jgi:DoxX-like family
MPFNPRSSGSLWTGRILGALVALFLLAESSVDLLLPSKVQAEMAATGFAANTLPILGVTTLCCAVLYAIPRTAIIGAILITGYLGGAICTHLRIGEFGSPPQIVSAVLGMMTWGGLYLRDARFRSLFAPNT